MSGPAFAPPRGEPPSIELLPPRRLAIDPSYQRSIATQSSQTLINHIAREWDWRLCVPLLVSRRGAELFVIDGQHRLEAARKRGDILYLPSCVSEYGSPADEAAVFVAANRRRRTVSTVDTFRAALLAGDARATAVDQLLGAAGLRLASSNSTRSMKPGELACVNALLRMLDQMGGARLGAALRVFARAFEGEVVAQPVSILAAIAALLAGPGAARADAVTGVLRRRCASEWWDAASADPLAKQGGPGLILAMRRTIDKELDPQPAAANPPASPPARQPASPPARQPASPPARQPASPPAGGGKHARSFEEQMEAVRAGAQLVEVKPLRRPDPDGTLGGVASGML